MRVVLKHSVLKEAVLRASSVVSKKETRIIMTTLLLDVQADKLRLLGTDMALGAVVEVEVEAAEPGQVCVPAGRLVSLVKTLPPGFVMLSLDNGNELSILGQYAEVDGVASSRARWLLHCHDPLQYPEFPAFKQKDAVEVEREPFVEVMKRVVVLVDREAKPGDPKMSPVLGVYLNDGTAYSTDGHAAAREICGVAVDDLLIPRDAVYLLLDLLDKSDSKYFKMVRNRQYVLFSFDGDTYHASLRDGKFPALDGAMFNPTATHPIVLSAPRKDLADAVDRATVTTNDRFWLLFTWEDGKLSLKTRNIVGDSFVEVLDDVRLVEGKCSRLERNYDIRLLSRILGVCRNDRVAMRFGTGTDNKQLMMRIEDDGMVAVLYPMRILPTGQAEK